MIFLLLRETGAPDGRTELISGGGKLKMFQAMGIFRLASLFLFFYSLQTKGTSAFSLSIQQTNNNSTALGSALQWYKKDKNPTRYVSFGLAILCATHQRCLR